MYMCVYVVCGRARKDGTLYLAGALEFVLQYLSDLPRCLGGG